MAVAVAVAGTSHIPPLFRRKEGKPRNNSSEKRSTKRPFIRSTLYIAHIRTGESLGTDRASSSAVLFIPDCVRGAR